MKRVHRLRKSCRPAIIKPNNISHAHAYHKKIIHLYLQYGRLSQVQAFEKLELISVFHNLLLHTLQVVCRLVCSMGEARKHFLDKIARFTV